VLVLLFRAIAYNLDSSFLVVSRLVAVVGISVYSGINSR